MLCVAKPYLSCPRRRQKPWQPGAHSVLARQPLALPTMGRDGVGVRMGGGEGGADGNGVERVEQVVSKSVSGSDTKSATDASGVDC